MRFRLQQRIVDEFAACAQDDAGEVRDRIAILLQGRADYLDKPDPTRWRSGDVHDLFMTYVAPRQVDVWDLAGRGVETMGDYLRFLEATDRLHPASTRVPTLLKELARLEPKFRAAMTDTSGWRLAKRIFTAMLADGITPDAEPAVLDGWAERFSGRDAEGRREVLGELMDRHSEYATGSIVIHGSQVAVLRSGVPPVKHLVWPDLVCDCGCEQQEQFPPVALPDLAVLAKSVAEQGSGLLRQLDRLSTWIGKPGRAVDDRGELRKGDRLELLGVDGLPAEALAMTALWRLALEFDIIRLRRTRVVPGVTAELVEAVLSGTGGVEETLDLWSDLAEGLIHPPVPTSVPKGGEHLRDWLKPWAPRYLGLLYAAGATGGPSDLDALVDQLLDEFDARLPPGNPDLFASIAALTVRNTLADLVRHGAVTVAGASLAGDSTFLPLQPEPGVTVELTDLGRYLVRRRLLAENADAPLLQVTGRGDGVAEGP